MGELVDMMLEGEGLETFLGSDRRIFIVAESYFYTGKVTGINDTCVLLEDARFVLESGSFEGKGLANAEKVKNGILYVQKNKIESFFESHE